jgi:pseudouridine synthase
LLTNDGNAANRLTHPKYNVDKMYLVRVEGKLSTAEKDRLERGVMLEDRKTAPCRIKDIKPRGGQTEFFITIHEGRKRQIRIMLQIVGHRVIHLKRIEQGPLKLGDLPVGKWRALDKKEINLLTESNRDT